VAALQLSAKGYAPGVLIDDTFGQDALNEVTGLFTEDQTGRWWIGRPVEVPGSRPLELEGGRSIGSRLVSWPRSHTVKCLVFMHPSDEIALWQQQARQIQELSQACALSGHELLLEVIPPKDLPADDLTVCNAMAQIYQLGVRPDWWKLPPQTTAGWQAVSALIEREAPHCRGVILLGLDAPLAELCAAFASSANFPICRGFAIGRTIFGAPAKAWLSGEIDDAQLQTQIRANYRQLTEAWLARHQAAGHNATGASV